MKEYIGNDNITLHIYDETLYSMASIEISYIPICADLLDYDIKDSWFFNRLIVPPNMRNKGIATKFMTRLIEILDEKDMRLVNTVNPYGDLNEDQLITFYKKFGFKEGSLDPNLKGLLVYFPEIKK